MEKLNFNQGDRPEKTNLGRRYASINLGGLKVLRENKVPEFKEFGEEFNNRLNVWAEFSPETERAISQKIIEPLEKIEKDFGLKMLLAIRDFQLHTSIMQGEFSDEENNKKIDEVFKNLTNRPELYDITSPIVKKSVNFKYLLIDKKGAIILTSTEIPEEIHSARSGISKNYISEGVKPIPIDILHITIARIKEIPEENRLKILEELNRKIRELRHNISSDPIGAIIEKINLAQGGVAKGGNTKPI